MPFFIKTHTNRSEDHFSTDKENKRNINEIGIFMDVLFASVDMRSIYTNDIILFPSFQITNQKVAIFLNNEYFI